MLDPEQLVWFLLGQMLVRINDLPVKERVRLVSDLSVYFKELDDDMNKGEGEPRI